MSVHLFFPLVVTDIIITHTHTKTESYNGCKKIEQLNREFTDEFHIPDFYIIQDLDDLYTLRRLHDISILLNMGSRRN